MRSICDKSPDYRCLLPAFLSTIDESDDDLCTHPDASFRRKYPLLAFLFTIARPDDDACTHPDTSFRRKYPLPAFLPTIDQTDDDLCTHLDAGPTSLHQACRPFACRTGCGICCDNASDAGLRFACPVCLSETPGAPPDGAMRLTISFWIYSSSSASAAASFARWMASAFAAERISISTRRFI